MLHFINTVLRLPVGKRYRALLLKNVSEGRTAKETLAFILEVVQHHTHKSGALLGAQGIFVVVGTYALDHGWPKAVALSAILLLLAGSLLIMSTLISTGKTFHVDPALQTRYALDLLAGRILRFNVALYLTFASIILLAAGALRLAR